jgi:hypothetical protein
VVDKFFKIREGGKRGEKGKKVDLDTNTYKNKGEKL